MPAVNESRFRVVCRECGRRGSLRGPIERVRFTLATLTICPCGGIHESLPNAAAFSTILEEETNETD